MAEERKALGVSLDDLGIADLLSSTSFVKGSDHHNQIEAFMLDIEKVRPNPFQPRKFFSAEELEKLASSIKAQGVLQPVAVREASSGFYELIAGERRLRACQIAGLGKIPAVINNISDQACLVLALIENIQREALNVIELAESLQSLAVRYGMTHAEVGKLIGKSRATVTNLIRLIQLSRPIKELMVKGLLDMGHARCLLSAPESMRESLAEKIIEQGLSVREVEVMIKKSVVQNEILSPFEGKSLASKSEGFDRLRVKLSNLAGGRVAIKGKVDQNGGWITLKCTTKDDLEAVVDRIAMACEQVDRVEV